MVVVVCGLSLRASLGSLAVPVVTMGLTASRLSGRGSHGLCASMVVIMVVVMLSLGGNLGLGSKSRLGSLAVPVVTVRLTSYGLGRGRSERLSSTSRVRVGVLCSTSSLAVPMVTVWLTANGLSRRGCKSLLGKNGREEAEKGDSESGGLHLDCSLCSVKASVYNKEQEVRLR